MSESTKSIARVEKEKPLSCCFAERGLTTVEYAIGLSGAAATVMLLIHASHDDLFFDIIMKWVTGLFMNVAQYGS